MGIHTFLRLTAVSFHNIWTLNMVEVEALLGLVKHYMFRSNGWSLGRRLFLTKGLKRITIVRYQRTDLLVN